MKFVQYKEDVIWKEGRMCLKGKPFEVDDEYALGVFSTDPQFEEFKYETQIEGPQAPKPTVLRGRAMCPKCGKAPNYYFHVKNCSG
jgi:hypothetical protein